MADEGLVLAVRARARLAQALSSSQHAEGHLQILGVGDWTPRSTRPSCNAIPGWPTANSSRLCGEIIVLRSLLQQASLPFQG
jgi:hypothetical protein